LKQVVKSSKAETTKLAGMIRIQANDAQDESKYTRFMLDAMPMCAMLWDKNVNLIDCNEESVRRFDMGSKGEFIGNFFNLSPKYQPDGRLSSETIVKNIYKAYDEGECYFDWVHQTPDGTPVPCEMTLVRIPYKNDYLIAAYLRDLQEHKNILAERFRFQLELEASLKIEQEINRENNAFLSAANRDIRAPVNFIVRLTEMMLSDDTLGDEFRDNLKKLNNAGISLLSVTDRIANTAMRAS